MSSLISQISSVSSARYGVNILEQDPPSGVNGAASNVIAIVGDFPWGPVDTVTTIDDPAALFAAFCPLEFGAANSYTAMRAFANKRFPGPLKIARTSNGSAAAAARTFDDASAGDSVTVTAKYPGVLGNSISIAWTANADDATARDATVTIGTAYTATYTRVATIVSSALVVTDPGDPFVTFSKPSGGTLVPVAASAAALTSGADGTAVAGDYTACIDLFSDASQKWNVGFVAELPSAMADTVNAYLKTFADTHLRGRWIMSSVPSQSKSTAQTYVATYRSDRLTMVWPQVKTANPFDPNRAEITVDGNAFAACAFAGVDPWESPGGAPGAEWMRGITGLAQAASLADLNAMNAKGISPFFMSTAMEGAILHNALTTSLTSGKTKAFRRAMTDYLVESLAAYLEPFTGRALDIDLRNRRLGAVTGPEIGGMEQFLAQLADDEHLRDWSVDPFGANVQTNINSGQWKILLAVQLMSVQEQIILLANVGEAVTVTEVEEA